MGTITFENREMILSANSQKEIDKMNKKIKKRPKVSGRFFVNEFKGFFFVIGGVYGDETNDQIAAAFNAKYQADIHCDLCNLEMRSAQEFADREGLFSVPMYGSSK